MKNVWAKTDKADKEFTKVMAIDGNGNFVEIPIQNLVIGQPAILELPNGAIVRTSPVMAWTIYGSTRIDTKSRSYYATV